MNQNINRGLIGYLLVFPTDKQVFPSLDFIGWYSVAVNPTAMHISIHEQLIGYHPTPILLTLQPTSTEQQKDSGVLPFKAYEPTVEIRCVIPCPTRFVEVPC